MNMELFKTVDTKVFAGILVFLFIVAVLFLELLSYAFRTMRISERMRIRKRLKAFSQTAYETLAPDILRKRVLSSVPMLNQILQHIPGLQGVDRLIEQANAKYPLGVFLLLSFILALIGFLGGALITKNNALSLIIAVLFCGLPLLYLKIKKNQRMKRFQHQLPEGLDLIARALRAGHAFTSGMKLAADQFPDPLGPEFAETLDEINFGVGVADALKGLAARVDCPDLKYFVVSVIIQREVGGNLAEVIESIARIVRERFKFHDKIRVLAAEGKISAQILIALPFVIIFALSYINPEYISALITEPMGRTMSVIAAVMMVIGIFVMMRMIKIKV